VSIVQLHLFPHVRGGIYLESSCRYERQSKSRGLKVAALPLDFLLWAHKPFRGQFIYSKSQEYQVIPVESSMRFSRSFYTTALMRKEVSSVVHHGGHTVLIHQALFSPNKMTSIMSFPLLNHLSVSFQKTLGKLTMKSSSVLSCWLHIHQSEHRLLHCQEQ
jgi:hypothetical protein